MRFSDALTFTTSAVGWEKRTSDRLADLVTTTAELDVSTLASLCVMGLPCVLDQTPYHGVTCSLQEREADPLPRSSSKQLRQPADGIEMLRGALGRAMDRAAGTAQRVAVLAGGGLDSGGLLALAMAWAQRTGGTAFGVALDFAGDGDDRPHLAALQAQLGCEVIRVSPEAAAARATLLRGIDAAPCNGPTAPMEIELMAQARANGADVVLMGVGGDELFDGDPRSLSRIARQGSIWRAVRAARALRGFARPRFPVGAWVARPLVARAIPRGLRMIRARRSRTAVPSWAGPNLESYFALSREKELEAVSRRFASSLEAITKSTDDAYRHYLAWGRHAEEVASGIERVDPYLDRTLIREVEQLPPEWLLHGGRRRGLFREAMRGLLPESLRLREDKASFEPALVRFVTAAGGLDSLRDCATMTNLAKLGVVKRSAFADAFDAFVASPDDGEAWTTLWPTLCVEAFLRERLRT